MSRFFPDPEGDQLRHDLVLDDRWYQQREKEAGTLLTGIIHVFSLSIGYRLILLPLVSGASYYLCPFIVCRRNVPQ